MSELKEVPITEIVIVEGHNPRREADAELCDSIKQHGVLTPILLRAKDGEEAYELIAGHRRVAAASAAGLKTIPAAIRTEVNETEAIVENVARKDLTLTEEAEAAHRLRERGFTKPKQVAELLSIPLGRAETYERLMALPAGIRELVHVGALSAGHIEVLAKIGAKSPELAEYIAAASAERRWTVAALKESWPDLVYDEGAGEEDEAERRFFPLHGTYETHELPLSEKGLELFEKLEALHDQWWHFRFSQDDVDAARAYGCLVDEDEINGEAGDRWSRNELIVTDRDWLRDRLEATLPGWIEEAEKQAQKRADRGQAPAPTTKKVAEMDDAEKAQRRKLLDEAAEVREKAHSFNLALGKQLFERIPEVPLTMEAVDALIAGVIDDDLSDLALRGLRYVDPALHDESRTKSGKLKVSFEEDRVKLEESALVYLNAAQEPAERLARFSVLLLAARYADHSIAPKSRRFGHQLTRGKGFGEWIEKLGKRLTPALRKDAEARRKKRAGEWNA